MRKIADSGKTDSAMRVEFPGRRDIAAEGLFDDDAGVLGQAGRAEAADHRGEKRRRDRQVVGRALSIAQGALQRLEGGRVLIVADHVMKQRHQALECGRVVERSVLLDAVAHVAVPLVGVPGR